MSVVNEAAKLSAFARRDLKIMLSYRVAAVAGFVGLAAQALVFSFIGKLVDPSRLPSYGATHTTYMAFVTIGIGLNMVVLLMLHQVATAMRTEQMIGTLESLLATPTAVSTLQAGSAVFELLYVPIRFGLFVGVVGLVFGLHFHPSGILPSLVVLIAFLPFVWGLGLISAGAIITFRRGSGALMIGGTVLGLSSGAFFPLALLPQWLQTIAAANPLAIAIRALREALIGGLGWRSIAPDLPELAVLSIIALAAGMLAFQFALKRERRNGTLGLY